MGKKIPISAFNPDLNLDNKLIKIEHRSWKIVITDKALFFNKDKHKNCLIMFRNLQEKVKRISNLNDDIGQVRQAKSNKIEKCKLEASSTEPHFK